MWIAYLASAVNLALGISLLAALLFTLTRLCPRPLGLILGILVYGLGSLPLDSPLHTLRCFLPNFHIYQCTFSAQSPPGLVGELLLANTLYGVLWIAFLALCRSLFTSKPSL